MILNILYFILPAALANMMPIFVKKLNIFGYPLDFGLKFGKERVLGENKTFRGVIFAILGALFIVYLQSYFSYGLIDFSKYNLIYLGFLFGFGVMFGDALGSFFKRRIKIKPGESFYVADQIDSILGLFLVFYWYLDLSLLFWVYTLIVWFLGHLILKYVGYLLKLENKKI